MRSSEKAVAAKNPETMVVHYGSRKGPKLVRIYKKAGLGVFRVEGEFHSSLLRQHRIDTEQDLFSVADIFYPAHIRFVEINWKKLRRHLRRKFGKTAAEDVFDEARRRRSSIRRVTRYLRREGVNNVHRFYKLLPINKEVKRALEKWSARFEDQYQQARMKTDRAGGVRHGK